MTNPEQSARMMAGMMNDPSACKVMVEEMVKDPQRCRNMMKAMVDRMDPASGQQMMQNCAAMSRRLDMRFHDTYMWMIASRVILWRQPPIYELPSRKSPRS